MATALSEIGREILGEGVNASAVFLLGQDSLIITIAMPAVAASIRATA